MIRVKYRRKKYGIGAVFVESRLKIEAFGRVWRWKWIKTLVR